LHCYALALVILYNMKVIETNRGGKKMYVKKSVFLYALDVIGKILFVSKTQI